MVATFTLELIQVMITAVIISNFLLQIAFCLFCFEHKTHHG
jgi:hypothetical protein